MTNNKFTPRELEDIQVLKDAQLSPSDNPIIKEYTVRVLAPTSMKALDEPNDNIFIANCLFVQCDKNTHHVAEIPNNTLIAKMMLTEDMTMFKVFLSQLKPNQVLEIECEELEDVNRLITIKAV